MNMKRFIRVFVSVMLVSSALFSTAYALLTADSETLVNSLDRPDDPKPDIKIVEDLSHGKKVQVKNTGNVPVMVNVFLSVYYQSDTDPNAILPANGFTYDKGTATTWIWSGNGASYTEVLEPKQLTDVLINDVTAPAAPDGYHLEVRVIAQNRPVEE